MLEKSPYKRGASAGFFFGIYLSVIFLIGACCGPQSVISNINSILFLGIPLYIYISLRRSYNQFGGKLALSDLWMQGIMTFAFAAIISSLVSFVYMKYINTALIHNQIVQATEALKALSTPESTAMAHQFEVLLENNAVPSASSLVIGMFWVITAGGSIISLICAVCVRLRKPISSKSVIS